MMINQEISLNSVVSSIQELNGREYYNLNTTGTNKIHGGAIRLIDYALDIKNSLFSLCKAEQGGGGGIYIVVKSPIGTKLFNIEKNAFEKCEAKFCRAIYIYSYQED